MRNFLDPESPVLQFITKIVYSVWLNILWFICCIPIVTIGPATTALFYTCQKMARDEDGYITRSFFHSFRENFRQATVLWLIMLGAGLLLGFDVYTVWHLRASAAGNLAVMWTLVLAVLFAVTVVYVIVLENIFPLLASVENTNRAMLKNALLIGTHYLFATILVFAVHFAMFYAVVAIFTPLIIFGEGLCAMISAWLLNNILISVSGEPDEDEA